MKKFFGRFWPLLTILLVLLLSCAWYARPVSVYVLDPGLQIKEMHGFVGVFRKDGGFDTHLVNFHSESDGFAEVLTQVEALRFRRSPLNLLRRFLPPGILRSQQTDEGDMDICRISPMRTATISASVFPSTTGSIPQRRFPGFFPLPLPTWRGNGQMRAPVRRWAVICGLTAKKPMPNSYFSIKLYKLDLL